MLNLNLNINVPPQMAARLTAAIELIADALDRRYPLALRPGVTGSDGHPGVTTRFDAEMSKQYERYVEAELEKGNLSPKDPEKFFSDDNLVY